MKYYLLRKTSDPGVKGVKSGLAQVELEINNPITNTILDFFSSNRYWEEQKFIPEFEIENCTASILKNAKLTDFLDFRPNVMTCPFIINERVYSVFKKFNIQSYYTYPVTLIDDKCRKLNVKYFIFCSPYLGHDVIDFSKTIFYLGNDLRGRQYINFLNQNEFEFFIKEKNIVPRMEKIVMNSTFDSTLDFFKARLGEMYVSEGLKDAIEILGLSGVDILDVEPFIVTPF